MVHRSVWQNQDKGLYCSVTRAGAAYACGVYVDLALFLACCFVLALTSRLRLDMESPCAQLPHRHIRCADQRAFSLTYLSLTYLSLTYLSLTYLSLTYLSLSLSLTFSSFAIAVETDPEHPAFDLEKFLIKLEQENK